MIVIAGTGLIIVLSITLLMHMGILLKRIPYSFVWGGRLKTDKEMYRFEAVSVSVSLICLWIALERLNVTNLISQKYSTAALWVMALLFLINTLGNLFSKNKFERNVFTPLTLLLTIFCIILAINQDV